MITLNIPTKISEIKEFLKNRTSKRYKYNCSLFNQVAKEICNEINSGYWNKDISKYMRETLTNSFNGKIWEIVREYRSKLK